MNKFLIGITILSIIVLAVGSFIAWRFLSTNNNYQGPTNPTITPTVTSVVSPQSAVQKKIAYVKDNALWIINEDGTDKKELSPSASSIIPALVWKNNNEITFARCGTTCKVFTKDILNGSEKTETEQTQVLAMDWDSKGNNLAYIYRLSDGQMKLNLETSNGTNTIKNFFSGPGRGGSLDDDVSVYFSPDDKKILVTNTLTVGNPQEKNTIWVLNSETGEVVKSVPITNRGWPTQAQWSNENNFFYKEGNLLVSDVIDDGSQVNEKSVGENFYNPLKFDDKTIFWVTTKALPQIMSTSNGPTNSLLVDGYFKPSVLNMNGLIALKSKLVSFGEESILPFETLGISKIDANSSQVFDLDTGVVERFAISP